MRILSALFSLIAALTVVGLGAASAQAMTAPAAPCHETTSANPSHHGMTDDAAPEAPRKAPAKPMKLMACCIACVAAAAPATPDAASFRIARSGLQPTPQPVRTGLTPAPEPEPPKA